jgi:hypothetical protein
MNLLSHRLLHLRFSLLIRTFFICINVVHVSDKGNFAIAHSAVRLPETRADQIELILNVE